MQKLNIGGLKVRPELFVNNFIHKVLVPVSYNMYNTTWI